MRPKDWIGVDLDGTLAHCGRRMGGHIGDPIPAMLERVKGWIAQGITVKIFTARAADPSNIPRVHAWVLEHVDTFLEVTNVKDKHMVELWDDRAVRVVKNKGAVDNYYNKCE